LDTPGVTDEDEFTRLSDFHPDRVDLVKNAANGTRFLIAKQGAAGLLDPGFVRDLISKTAPEEAPVPVTAEQGEATLPNGIVIKGSPAAMAAFIHAASERGDAADVEKAKNDTADREKKAASGAAMPDGSYPIASEADLGKAIRAVGRGGASHNAIRRHIITRARSLGASSKIPDNWNSDGSLKGDVAKEAGMPQAVAKDLMDAAGDSMPLDDGMDGLDPTVPLAAPDGDMDLPGDPADPGSPAWEGIDAASASKVLSILARMKNATLMLAEREMLEAASADPSDAENAFSLEDAACAIEYAISLLAVFAAGEQAEAEIGAEMAEMCKALAGADLAPLGVVEGLTAVAKAGRVLSASNEAKLRSAAQAIGEVLSSLPQAPEGVAKSKEAPVPAVKTRAAQVAKETMSPEAQAADTGPVSAGGTTGLGEPRETGPAAALPGDGPQAALPGDMPGRTVVKGALRVAVRDMTRRLVHVRADKIRDPAEHFAQVAKADDGGDGKVTMQAVFDEEGNLVGIVDPADITPVSGAGGSSGDDSGGDDGDAAAAPAPAADDMTPQPPADAGTPADAVGKAAQDVITLTSDVAKSIAEQAAKTALEASEAAHAQVVAKMAADNAGLAEQVEAMKSRLETVENTPAAPRVFTNGQVPPAHTLRGQDQGGAQIDVAKARETRAAFLRADPAEQNRLANEMQQGAIAVLDALHGRA
jgi:hypothetical protein